MLKSKTMKRLFCGLLLLILGQTSLTYAVIPQVLDIQRWSTSNGTKVYFVHSPNLPMIDINIVFYAGSAYDKDKPGLSTLTNIMLTEGTQQFNADEIADNFADVGAIFDVDSGRDMGALHLRSLTDTKLLESALTSFHSVVAESNFPEASFKRRQKEVLQAIKDHAQSPSAIAQKAFYHELYGDGPYGHPTLGNAESVKMLTVNDVKAFHKKYYVAKNAVITIVGNIDKEHAHFISNQIMQGLHQGEKQKLKVIAASNKKSELEKINYPSKQTHIITGQIGINYKSLNYFPLSVGNYILGGGILVSRLSDVIREKNALAYHVDSRFIPLERNGPFIIRLQTRNKEANKALKLTRDTLDNFIKKGPSNDELRSAKQYIIGHFPLTLDNNASISNHLLKMGFYNLPIDYLDTYRYNINTVTSKKINNAFKETIRPKEFMTVMVGKTEEGKNNDTSN